MLFRSQKNDPKSLFNTYKSIFKLRKEESINNGDITFIDIDNEDSYTYINETDKSKFLVVANFRNVKIALSLDINIENYKNIYYNYNIRELTNYIELKPYEALVYKLDK